MFLNLIFSNALEMLEKKKNSREKKKKVRFIPEVLDSQLQIMQQMENSCKIINCRCRRKLTHQFVINLYGMFNSVN